jgi:hypothetical protein
MEYWPSGMYRAPETFQIALFVVGTVAILILAKVCCWWWCGSRCHQLVLLKHIAILRYHGDVHPGSIAKIWIAQDGSMIASVAI